MQEPTNTDFVESLKQLFITRQEIRALVEHQQKLFDNLKQLDANHHTIHEHLRTLTESHNRVQSYTTSLVKGREEMVQMLQNLDESHQSTKREVQKAMETLAYIQQQIDKVNLIESRVTKIEHTLNLIQNDERQDDKISAETEVRIRNLERKL